jgi:raffinose/stachyose/melibiose transport system substrate-binding protein
MINQGTWAIDSFAADYDLDEINKRIGMFGLSLYSDTVNWSSSSPGATYIVPKTGDSEKEKGAIEFIKYITGPAYQELCNELNMKPVIEGFETPEISIIAKNEIYEAFEKKGAPTFDMFILVPYGSFDVFMQEMFAGTKTPLDVAEALSVEFAKNAKAAGLEGW